MPQIVACNHCQQRFMAEDHLLGTVVPCPACSAALAIPAPAAPNSAPASGLASFRAAGLSAMKGLPADRRLRQRYIALAVVAVACAVWLLLAMPNVLLWVFARPAASFEKVGAGAAIFWVGVLAACGGILEWSFFMNSYKMRAMRDWFGYEGARWFYVGLGGVIGVMGLGLTVSATAYSLFGTVKHSRERPEFVAKAVQGQPLVGPQVSGRPGPVVAPLPPATTVPKRKTSPFARPPVENAPGERAPAESAPAEGAPVAATPVAETAVPAEPARRVGDELPGQWRQLEGGFCIKFPDSIPINRDGLYHKPHGVEQQIGGQSHIGKDALMFSVNVERSEDPGRIKINPAQLLLDIRAGRVQGQDFGGDVINLNGLLVVKSESHNSQRDAFGRGPYMLHGTTYHYGDGTISVSIRVSSQLPLDDARQAELRKYAETFQRLPAGSEDATAAAEKTKPVATWIVLESGFRIKLSPAIALSENSIGRHGGEVTLHYLRGKTRELVNIKVDALYSPKWNETNEAKTVAEKRDRLTRMNRGYEHIAVDVNGMMMERITISPRDGRGGTTKVQYKFREGQHQIEMEVWSELPLDHPSFQAALRDVETIERYTP